jgi:ABC-type Fe3+/spermidine/putrescine transport system ATPase subunit
LTQAVAGTDDSDFLQLVGLCKTYGNQRVVDDFSISVRKGEFVSILGPSGCGKTTTLRMVAGFIDPDAGHIRIEGRGIETVPAHRRGTAMVFQNYALFPHMTVFENVAFGLRMQKVEKSEIARRVGEALELVRLPDMGDRYPKQLSGGQQQRVALARAVAVNPSVLLLDEPLSNLDAKLRKELRTEFLEIHRLSGITSLFVTHDLEEAFSLSDRVAVMNGGGLEQFGTPSEIFDSPKTGFVAEFVGHTNIFTGTVEPLAEGIGLLNSGGLGIRVALGSRPPGAAAKIAIPNHALVVSAEPTQCENDFVAEITANSYTGTRMHLRLDLAGHVVSADLPANKAVKALQEAASVHVGWDSDNAVLIPDDGNMPK